MQGSLTRSLSLSLEDHVSLCRTRRETLVWLVALIIQTGTVSLWRLAGHVDTRAKTLSAHRWFERFFQHVHLDKISIARLIVHIIRTSPKARLRRAANSSSSNLAARLTWVEGMLSMPNSAITDPASRV